MNSNGQHHWRSDAQFNTKTLFGFFIKSVFDDRGRLPTKGSIELIFEGECGRKFKLHHRQDCCESVSVDDIVGDVTDLIGAMIYHAEEVNHDDCGMPAPSDDETGCYSEHETWTFYKLLTSKGWVEFRWHGSSNGFYSESVDFAIYEQAAHAGVTVPEGYEHKYWEWRDK